MNRPAQARSLRKALIFIPLLLVAAALLQRRIDATTLSETAQHEELLIRSGTLIKKISLGYDALLADIYWTRVVQYYGSRVGFRNAKFDLLPPLLDITVTLDPKLVVAYRFGAIFLSEGGAMGAGRSDLAVALVKRGIATNPNQWVLYSDLGFLYYWRLKDYPEAAKAYLAGGQVPNAPPLMKMMAAHIAAKGGSIETSRMILSELYASTKDPNVRKAVLNHLRAVRAQEDEMHLDELIADYRKRFSENPKSTRDLVAAGLIPGIPLDPMGFPYAIGKDGRSHLHPNSPVEQTKP